MSYSRRQTDPGVHAFFVDRERWGREVRICEGAHGYSDVLYVVAFNGVVNRCTALGAKTERDFVSFVANSNVLARLTANRDGVARKPCLGAEDTPRSALTRETMADGDSNWLGPRCECQLSATARGCSSIHAAAERNGVGVGCLAFAFLKLPRPLRRFEGRMCVREDCG